MRKIWIKLACWLLGHKNGGKGVEESKFNWRIGKMDWCWQYYCPRCQDPENFPLNQHLDIRNLYQRTVGVQLSCLRNRWIFRNFSKRWERDKRREHHLLQLG